MIAKIEKPKWKRGKRAMPVPETYRAETRAFMARGGALEFWKAKDPAVLFEGPAGTGKTRAMLEKFHYCAMRYPGCRILMVRQTRESMTQSVLVTYEEKVVPPGSSCLKGPKRNLRQSYKYPNGSEIVVGGLDKPDKVMSSEYDLIGMFEATESSEDSYEKLNSRLRNGVIPYQQIACDVNPSYPQHYLNQKAKKGLMKRIRSRHVDNPMLFDDAGRPTSVGTIYLEKLKALSGHRYLRLYKGIWAAAEGLVYDAFDPTIHSINRFKIPSSWRRIRVIDFGYTNPFVCQWWAIDPDGVMYRYREIYMSRRLVAHHAKIINSLSEGERFEATIADHDAEDRASLHSEDIWTIPAYKDVQRGIEAVSLRLRPLEPGVGPKMFLLKDSLVETDNQLKESGLPIKTEDEFDGYSYPNAKEGKEKKEDPIKKDDHGLDATRYAVAYVDNLSGMVINATSDEAAIVEEIQYAGRVQDGLLPGFYDDADEDNVVFA